MKNPANHIYSLRNDYETRRLNRATARRNPFEQFEIWLSEAIEGNIFEPNAMVLATATAGGKPSRSSCGTTHSGRRGIPLHLLRAGHD